MRKIAVTKWLTDIELTKSMKLAKSKEEYQRLLAIRLVCRAFTLCQVADMLAVSETTLQRWIQSFNSTGPTGLRPGKRGGRRHSLLSLEQERSLILRWARGEERNAKELQKIVSGQCGHSVSLKYIYDLIRRHLPKPPY